MYLGLGNALDKKNAPVVAAMVRAVSLKGWIDVTSRARSLDTKKFESPDLLPAVPCAVVPHRHWSAWTSTLPHASLHAGLNVNEIIIKVLYKSST